MTRHLEVQNRIRKNYSSLPENQKRIADFVVENLDLIPFLSVHEVAKATASSVASVVRFAQRIGLEGYSAMREKVGTALQQHLKAEDLFPAIRKSILKGDTLLSVATQDIGNINETLNVLERETFGDVVKSILHSERVFTAGLGISYLMARILAYQLNQIGIEAIALRHGSASFAEQSFYFGKKDLLIVFSFPPYSKETLELAKLVHERHIRIVAITNKSTAPISFHADHNLIVRSKNIMLFTNSFAAISMVINAISTECALKSQAKAGRMVTQVNEITKSQKVTL